MVELSGFHDGFFDGLWLSPTRCTHLFLRTASGERFTLILGGMERANLTTLREGNILFDVAVVPTDQLTIEDISEASQLGASESSIAAKMLENARQEGLAALRISSSYGASGAFLFKSSDMLQGHVIGKFDPVNL